MDTIGTSVNAGNFGACVADGPSKPEEQVIDPDSAIRAFDPLVRKSHPAADPGPLGARVCGDRAAVESARLSCPVSFSSSLSQFDTAIMDELHAARRYCLRLSVIPDDSPGE